MNIKGNKAIGIEIENGFRYRILMFANSIILFPLRILTFYRYTSIGKISALFLFLSLCLLFFAIAVENGAFTGLVITNAALVIIISGFVYDPLLENKKVRFPLFFFVLPRVVINALFISQIYVILYRISRKDSEGIFLIIMDISADGLTEAWLLNCSIVLAILVAAIYARQIRQFCN